LEKEKTRIQGIQFKNKFDSTFTLKPPIVKNGINPKGEKMKASLKLSLRFPPFMKTLLKSLFKIQIPARIAITMGRTSASLAIAAPTRVAVDNPGIILYHCPRYQAAVSPKDDIVKEKRICQ
jgi:hypothetical protein